MLDLSVFECYVVFLNAGINFFLIADKNQLVDIKLINGKHCAFDNFKRCVVAAHSVNNYIHLITFSNSSSARFDSAAYLSFLSRILGSIGGKIPKFAPIG